MANRIGLSRSALEPGVSDARVAIARRGGAFLARPAVLQTRASRGVVAWHQDYSYWTRTQPMAHLSCWIGLDDSTVENGCVHYVPGSHRWELLPITGLANDMDAIQSVLSDDQKAQFKPVAIELKAGECSFHHPLMVHGSFENQSDRPRRGAVINVVRDGVRSASNEPLLEGVPPIPAGEKLDGQFFPLLSEPETQHVT